MAWWRWGLNRDEDSYHNTTFNACIGRKLRATHAADGRGNDTPLRHARGGIRQDTQIMAESSEGSFHYPPLSPCDILILDSAEQISYQPNQVQDTPVHGLSRSDRIQLDSLLSEIGCGLVLVDRREQETADSVYVSLFMLYYSHGIVDAGTSKSFVYDLELRSRRDIRITEHGDLNEIYRRTYNDTTLYKPVKEGWYIELDHSR